MMEKSAQPGEGEVYKPTLFQTSRTKFWCTLQLKWQIHSPSLYTVKKIYEIPGLFLIKSSWECLKSFQRAESYCKFCYVPRQFFPFLRIWNVSFLWTGIFFPVSERLNSLNSWIMTFPGIFLPVDTENPFFVVVLVFSKYHATMPHKLATTPIHQSYSRWNKSI